MEGKGIATVGSQSCLAAARLGCVDYLRFDDLQVADLDTTGGKVRDLELDVDRALGFSFSDTTHATTKTTSHTTATLVVTLDTRQTEFSSHQELLATPELFDLPDYGRLLGRIVHGTNVSAKPRRVCVVRNRNSDFNIVGSGSSLELSLGFEHIFHARAGVRLNDAFNPNKGLDCGIEAVAHQLELAIGRDEADGAIILEAGESHTLVELDVFHLYGFAAGSPTGGLEHDLIIEAQAEFRHAGEVAFHLDRTKDLRAKDVAGRRHEQVERFNDIEEDLILAIADAFTTPGHGVGDSNRRPSLHLELVRFLGDVLL